MAYLIGFLSIYLWAYLYISTTLSRASLFLQKKRVQALSSDCRQSPHVKVWTFLVFSTIQMHLYDIHTTKALRFQCFRGIIYMKRGAL